MLTNSSLKSVKAVFQLKKGYLDCYYTSADPEGGQGVRTPLENHKLYGFL